MKQLIVNADDFGLTTKVSEGIIHTHHYGIVMSASLMANGEAFEAAVAMSRRAPELAIGMHLNLSEGVPVTPAFRIPSLVDARGRLYFTPGRLWSGIVTRKISLLEVERELHAQIEKALRAGISPSHLDGHKHVHVLPGISAAVIRLAQRFGIRSVRCPVEEAPSLIGLVQRRQEDKTAITKQYIVGRAVSHFARRFKKNLAQAGLSCAGRLYGLSQTGFLDAVGLQDILRGLPRGSSELMCHPGYVDADLLRTRTRLLAQREVEIQALIASENRKLVKEQGIQLMSYRDLLVGTEANKAAA